MSNQSGGDISVYVRMRKIFLLLVLLLTGVLMACLGPHKPADVTCGASSTGMYDDLTDEEKDLLERGGLAGNAGSEVTFAQRYVLDSIRDMLAHIETKYQREFTVHAFHSMSVNEDYDTLYVFPKGLDKAIDVVTVKRMQRSSERYDYKDDFAAVYCRPTLEALATEYFDDAFGKGHAKIFMTMGCDKNYLFDGKEDPEGLLRKAVVWGSGVMYLSEADIAQEDMESVLMAYGEDFRAKGIETELGVFLMEADVFDTVRYSNYESMYRNPGMIIRYDVGISKEKITIECAS